MSQLVNIKAFGKTRELHPSDDEIKRRSLIRLGRRLAYLTIIWNSIEGIIAVSAGILAGSIALVGFGVDSVIEVSSGAIILWRLVSGEHREQLALKCEWYRHHFNFLIDMACVPIVRLRGYTLSDLSGG